MGLHTVNVWHRLNASEEGGRAVVSLGVVDAQRNVPPQILSAVDELLENIAPAGETAAYAVKRFGSPGETGSFVCLVASHRYVDRWDRRAALNHARILRVDSADPWLDVHALVELAVEFESDNALVMSPEGIRDRVLQVENNVQVTEWSEMPFEEVEHALAQTVIEICVSRVSNPEPIAVPLPPQSSTLAALRGAAAAWASLPMAIQRASEFSIDAKKGTRVKILFTTAGRGEQPQANQQTREFAASYIQWLHDRPDDARDLIMNPDITDGPTLRRTFEQAKVPLAILHADARAPLMNPETSAATTPVSEFDRRNVPQPTQREERTMAKNKRPAEGPRRELDPAVTRYINEQVAAAEDSLREYVKKWAGAVQQGADRGGAAPRDPGGVPAPSRFPRRWSEIAAATGAGAIGGALVASLAIFMMRPHTSVPASRPDRAEIAATQTIATTTQEGTPAVQPPTRTSADSLAGATWADRFQTLSDTDPKRLASVVDAITANVTPDAKTRFGKLRAQIESGKPLANADRKFLRGILYQMLVQKIGGADFRIDGKFESVPAAAVKFVTEDLNLESTKSGTDRDIANIEAEAILRWAARQSL
jgi:hypothetical protein